MIRLRYENSIEEEELDTDYTAFLLWTQQTLKSDIAQFVYVTERDGGQVAINPNRILSVREFYPEEDED